MAINKMSKPRMLSAGLIKDILDTPNEELEARMAKTPTKEEDKPDLKDKHEKPSSKKYWIAGVVLALAAVIGGITYKKMKR